MNAVMDEEPVVIGSVEAKAQGRKTYFTGKPCKRGHIDQRLVANANCVQCNRDNSDAFNAQRRGRPPGTSMHTEGFTRDPAMWPDDGGKLRVPIYDHNFGQKRLVRRVGWTNCLGRDPVHRIFSADVARERICTSCKTRQSTADLFQPRTCGARARG